MGWSSKEVLLHLMYRPFFFFIYEWACSKIINSWIRSKVFSYLEDEKLNGRLLANNLKYQSLCHLMPIQKESARRDFFFGLKHEYSEKLKLKYKQYLYHWKRNETIQFTPLYLSTIEHISLQTHTHIQQSNVLIKLIVAVLFGRAFQNTHIIMILYAPNTYKNDILHSIRSNIPGICAVTHSTHFALWQNPADRPGRNIFV